MGIDDRFRRQLAKEIPQWVDDHIIDSSQQAQLTAKYQLDQLQFAASNRFVSILLAIGGLLVGLGGISFVAANWDYISPGIRAIGMIVIMLTCDGVGYWLWQGKTETTSGKQWLGHAFLLIGQLLLGACIGLMGQWLQVDGNISGLFLLWAVGVLGVAIGLRHTWSGLVAIALFYSGFQSMWDWRSAAALSPFIASIFRALPVYAPFLFVFLAYWCRSRWLLIFGLFATTAITLLGIDNSLVYSGNDYWFWMAAIALSTAMWVSSFIHNRYRDRLLTWLGIDSRNLDNASNSLDFAPIYQFQGLLGLLFTLYLMGFSDYIGLTGIASIRGFGWSQLSVLILWGIALIFGGLHWRDRLSRRTVLPQELGMVDTVFSAVSIATLVLMQLGDWGILSVFLLNGLYFAVAAVLTWQGLKQGIRWRFWLGLISISGQILTRFFEYDTGLLLKSLVLMVCGIGIILAGLSFERYQQAIASKTSTTPALQNS